MPDEENLGDMIRQWREARDPADVPAYAALPARRTRRRCLTQTDMGLLTGVSERWYRRLESGHQKKFSLRFLDSVSRVLGLTEDQRAWLYPAAGQPAPRKHSFGELDITMVDLLHAQPWPAYISDSAWDVRAWNEQAARQWPFVTQPGANITEYVLAPDTAHQLPDWEQAWARPMVAQLRMALLEDEDNERLQEVAALVREYEPVERLWQRDHLLLRGSYGRTAQVHVPHLAAEARMQLAVLTPLYDTRLRLVVGLLPDAGPLPDPQAAEAEVNSDEEGRPAA